jgi:hypothetical protein
MACPSRLIHIAALNLTAPVRRDLTPESIARVLAALRADIQATHARDAGARRRGDSS